MATLIQTFHTVQTALPLELYGQLQQVRKRYAAALLAASRGDYSRRRELGAVSRQVGRLLAREARKSPEERGGLRMLDLSLAVDRLFPELRGWNQQEALRSRLRKIKAS